MYLFLIRFKAKEAENIAEKCIRHEEKRQVLYSCFFQFETIDPGQNSFYLGLLLPGRDIMAKASSIKENI